MVYNLNKKGSKMNKEFKEYLEELRKVNYYKNYGTKQRSNKALFTHKEMGTYFTLSNLIHGKELVRNAVLQNEINSINLLTKNNITIFKTTTLNPNMNVTFNKNSFEEELKKQHKTFSKFFNAIYFNNKKKELKYKSIRVYELSEKFNLHNHKIDFLENIEQFNDYITSIILARRKFEVGRVEIVFNEEHFARVREMFKNGEVKIRVDNKYITLRLYKNHYNKKGDTYFISNTNKDKSNNIYIRTVKDKLNNKEHMTKYLFKYLLKTYSREKEHIDNIIFQQFKIRRKTYSQKFFGFNMEILEKINMRLFTYFKQKENHQATNLDILKVEDLNELLDNKNNLYFTISKMITERKFYYEEEIDHLLYVVHKEKYEEFIDFNSKYEFEQFFDQFLFDAEVLLNRNHKNEEERLKAFCNFYNNLYLHYNIYEDHLTPAKIRKELREWRQEYRREQEKRIMQIMEKDPFYNMTHEEHERVNYNNYVKNNPSYSKSFEEYLKTGF